MLCWSYACQLSPIMMNQHELRWIFRPVLSLSRTRCFELFPHQSTSISAKRAGISIESKACSAPLQSIFLLYNFKRRTRTGRETSRTKGPLPVSHVHSISIPPWPTQYESSRMVNLKEDLPYSTRRSRELSDHVRHVYDSWRNT